MSKKNSGFSQKYFKGGCQNCILNVQSFILRKKKLRILRIFLSISDFEQKYFWLFGQMYLDGFVIFSIYVSRKTRWRKMFFFKLFVLVIFLEIEKKVVRLLTVFLFMVVKTALNLPMGTFRGDVCFWGNYFLNFYGK